jgi:predicted nucleic-acid-binding Zn-ribbon protein
VKVTGISFTCTRCRYAEFYHADSSLLGNIFDLFTN